MRLRVLFPFILFALLGAALLSVSQEPIAGDDSATVAGQRSFPRWNLSPLSPRLPLSSETTDATKQQVLANYGNLPLGFEANRGQTGAQVEFLSRGNDFSVLLTRDAELLLVPRRSVRSGRSVGSNLALASAPSRNASVGDTIAGNPAKLVRMRWVGANPGPRVVPLEELPGKSSYFIGNDPDRWRSDIPSYARVKYRDVYPGVDLVFYGSRKQMEYDLILSPGADPGRITFAIQGSNKLRIDAHGDLLLRANGGEIRLRKPQVYQQTSQAKRLIDGRYVFKGRGRVGFELDTYDKGKPLVIDPVLVYSTYLGGSGLDEAHSIAVDASGNAYVTGETESVDFPATTGALQTTLKGTTDAFVTKLNPSGSAVIYSTYLGGGADDVSNAITLDPAGNAYLTGSTGSIDFPTTRGAFQTVFAGGDDAFVTKLNSTGTSLLYSTYFGGAGNDTGLGIAVDSSGNAYVMGPTSSSDIGTTAGAFQSNLKGLDDLFAIKLNPGGTALLYFTYVGGSMDDEGTGLAVDSSGNAYLTGSTQSADFPITAGAFQTALKGADNTFVTKLNPGGTALLYSTFLGGTMTDEARAIAVDSSGNAYVTGEASSADFPTTAGALKTSLTGSDDVFVTKLNPTGSALVYSTYLGGSDGEGGVGIAVDAAGNAYITGDTSSADFPVTPCSTQPVYGSPPPPLGRDDAFVAKLDPAGSSLLYSSYLGGNMDEDGNGIAVDSSGNIYVTGETSSTNFPTAGTPVQAAIAGMADVFVTKIDPRPTPVVTLAPAILTFANQAVGTTSSSQPITLTNSGGLPLMTITGIVASGDFGVTNNCVTPLAAGASCIINVTFTPTAIGSRVGTISVNSSGCGSSPMVALTGMGASATAGFTLTPAPGSGGGSGNQVTLVPGDTGKFTILFTPNPGFVGTVVFACTNLPPNTICTVTPSPVTVTGPGVITLTVTLRTNCIATTGRRPVPGPLGIQPPLGALWLAALLLLALFKKYGPEARAARLAPALALVLLIIVCAGCTGTSGSPALPGSPRTPAGLYVITVTGSVAGGPTQTINLNVRVI